MSTTAPRSRTSSTKSAPDRSPVALDLDTLERENTPAPFVVRIGGRRVTLTDVRELDWQVAASLSPERPFSFFEAVVPEDEQEHFLGAKMELWKVEKMAADYRDHYGLGDQGN